MDTATPTPTKKLADLSFAERGKFLIEKYKLINGQKMDPLEAEAKTRVAFGLTPLTEAEQQQLKDKNIVEKIVDSTPLQVIGASAIIHKTWDKYINGAKDLATEKLETAKAAAITKADDLKEQAKEKAVNTTQTVIAKVADTVGLKTEQVTGSPEAAFLNTPEENATISTSTPTATEQHATTQTIPIEPAAESSSVNTTLTTPVSVETTTTATAARTTNTNTDALIETEAQKTAVFDRVPVEAQAVAMSPNAEM